MSERDSTCAVEYRPIPGFPGYQAGSDGTIIGRTGRKLKPYIHYGYEHVGTCTDTGKSRGMMRVHRLVLFAFVGPCPDGMECCHNDGNRRNNHISNLRWDTPANNSADRVKHGTDLRGSQLSYAKLTESKVLKIRDDAASGKPNKVIADENGVSVSTVQRVRGGKMWRHAGGTVRGQREIFCWQAVVNVLGELGLRSISLNTPHVLDRVAALLGWSDKPAHRHLVMRALRFHPGTLVKGYDWHAGPRKRTRVIVMSLPENAKCERSEG